MVTVYTCRFTQYLYVYVNCIFRYGVYCGYVSFVLQCVQSVYSQLAVLVFSVSSQFIFRVLTVYRSAEFNNMSVPKYKVTMYN